MKNGKKILCLLLVLSLLAALSACGGFSPRIMIAMQRLSKLQSLQSDTVLKADATLSLFGEALPLAMEAHVRGEHQKEPSLSAYDATLSVSEFSQHVLVYQSKNDAGLTVLSYSMDGGESWTQSEPQAAVEAEGADLVKAALVLVDLFKENGTVALPDGGEGIVFEGTIPAAYTQELFKSMGLHEELNELLPVEVDESALALAGEVPAKLVVDKQSGMLVRVELDLTQTFKGLICALFEQYLAAYGLEEIAELELGSITCVTELSGFDSVSVTLPEMTIK